MKTVTAVEPSSFTQHAERSVAMPAAPANTLTVNGDCGLGNQMFKYASGLYFARLFERQLEIVKPLPANQQWKGFSRPFQLDKFCIEASVREPQLLDRLLFSGNQRIRRWHGRVQKLLRVRLIEEPEAYRHHDLEQPDPKIARAYINGYWQAARYVDAVEPQLRAQFRLREPLSEKSLDYATRIMRLPLPVSVHIRVGDYSLITHPSGPDGQRVSNVLPLQYYERALAAVAKQFAGFTFVVFSDDPEKAKQLLPALDNCLFVEGNGPDAAHEDLFLMSLCRHHVIANSSFSWWGAWLNPNPDKCVFAPRYWGNTPDSYFPDLYPAGWTVIDNL
jgi:hypothetical protein